MTAPWDGLCGSRHAALAKPPYLQAGQVHRLGLNTGLLWLRWSLVNDRLTGLPTMPGVQNILACPDLHAQTFCHAMHALALWHHGTHWHHLHTASAAVLLKKIPHTLWPHCDCETGQGQARWWPRRCSTFSPVGNLFLHQAETPVGVSSSWQACWLMSWIVMTAC